jgi:hypothetical protein
MHLGAKRAGSCHYGWVVEPYVTGGVVVEVPVVVVAVVVVPVVPVVAVVPVVPVVPVVVAGEAAA